MRLSGGVCMCEVYSLPSLKFMYIVCMIMYGINHYLWSFIVNNDFDNSSTIIFGTTKLRCIFLHTYTHASAHLLDGRHRVKMEKEEDVWSCINVNYLPRSYNWILPNYLLWWLINATISRCTMNTICHWFLFRERDDLVLIVQALEWVRFKAQTCLRI